MPNPHTTTNTTTKTPSPYNAHNPDPTDATLMARPTLPFGPYSIPTSHIFHISRSGLTHAFVNLKPLLPGHVLVVPRRVIPRYTDLTLRETNDLALTVRRVARLVERVYGATALNIAMQDGRAAGQSVAHVHFHLIPRREGDFDERGGGDEVYRILEEEGGEADVGAGLRVRDRLREGAEGGEGEKEKRARAPPKTDAERLPRGHEEMAREAEMLRREMEKDVQEEDEAEDEEALRN